MAAWRADHDYDDHYDVPRQAFVAQRVRWAVQQSLRDADPMPTRLRQDARQVAAAEWALLAQQQRPVEMNLAAASGLSVRRVRQVQSWPQVVPLTPDAAAVEDADPLAGAGAEQERVALARALRQLPERDRDMVTARYLHGDSVVEVAQRHGVSQGRVSQIVRAALERIRAHMAQELAY